MASNNTLLPIAVIIIIIIVAMLALNFLPIQTSVGQATLNYPYPQVNEVVSSCIDTDNEDVFVKGVLSFPNEGELIYSAADVCDSDTMLLERVCVGNGYGTIHVPCDNGCIDGKCV